MTSRPLAVPPRAAWHTAACWGCAQPLLVALALIGCSPDLPPIPPGGRVLCSSKAECPADHKCSEYLGQCVREGEDDEAPLLVEPLAVLPAAAKVGDTVRASFGVSEPLAQVPTVRLATPGHAPGVFMLGERDGDLRFSYVLTVTGSEPQQAVNVVATVWDIYGNRAPDLIVGSVTFDFLAPSIFDVQALGNTYLRDGVQARLSLRMTEDPADWADAATFPSVSFEDGAPFTLEEASQNERLFTYAYTTTGSEPQGAAAVVITARDAAGNVAAPPPFPLFVIDRERPAVEELQELTRTARPGEVAVVKFTLTEDVDTAPDVQLVPAAGDTLFMDLVRQAGNQLEYRFQFPLTATQVVMEYEAFVGQVSDRAGNTMDRTRLGAASDELRFDGEPPYFVDAAMAPSPPLLVTDPPRVNSGGELRVAFRVNPSDPVFTAKVFLDLVDTRLPLPPETTAGAPGDENVYALTLERDLHPEGSGLIKVQVTDEAGNDSAVEVLGPVTVDYTAPELLLTVVPDFAERAAHRGEVVAFLVVANEPLAPLAAGGIVLTTALETAPGVYDDAQTLSLAAPSVSGTTYVWTTNVASGQLGTYRVQVRGLDQAGNATAAVTQGLVRVDGEVPEIIPATVTLEHGLKYSLQPGHEEVLLSFEVSEELVNLAVRIGAAGVDSCDADACDPGFFVDRMPAVGAVKYICCYTFPNDGSVADGTKEVRIEGHDPAGNIAGATSFVELDTVAPSLEVEIVPAQVALAEVITISLKSDEPLDPASVTLLASGLLPDGTPPSQSSATYAGWTKTVEKGLVGLFSVSVTATDAVGNQGSTSAAAQVLVDGEVPELAGVSVNRTHFSLANPDVVVTFDSSEPIAITGGLVVRVSGTDAVGGPEIHDMACTEAGLTYTCTHAFVAGDNHGTKTIVIEARDAVGNTATESRDVVLDLVAPVLTLDKTPVSRAAAAGETLSFVVTSTEVLDGASLQVTDDGGTPIATVMPGVDEPAGDDQTVYAWRFDVVDGDTGSALLQVSAADLAGNAAVLQAGPSCGAVPCAVGWDGDPPSVTIEVPAESPVAVYSAMAGFETIAVSFTLSELLPLDSIPGVVVTIGGVAPSNGCTQPGAGSYIYTCEHTVTAGASPSPAQDGLQEIRVRAVDAATNELVAQREIVVDRTAPVLDASLSPASGAQAGRGAILQLVVASNEPLDFANAGFIADPARPCPAAAVGTPCDMTAGTFDAPIQLGPSLYLWKHAVTSTDRGLYYVQATLTDRVGNAATTPAGLYFDVRSDLPTVQNIRFDGGRTRYSRVAGYEHLELLFDSATEFAAVDVSINIQGGADDTAKPLACTLSGPPYVYACPYTFTAADPEGTQIVTIKVTDGAGNSLQVNTAAELDVTPPTLAWSVYPDPAMRPARRDETLTVTLSSLNEPLLVPNPVVSAAFAFNDGGLGIAGDPVASGNSYTWSYAVPSGQKGRFDLGAQAFDTVGNGPAAPAAAHVLVDGEAPQIQALALPDGTSYGPNRSTVTLTFTVSNLDPDTGAQVLPAEVTANVGLPAPVGTTMTCTVSGPGPFAYTCAHDLSTSGNGAYELSVFAADAAGNIAFDSGLVTYDGNAPVLSLTVVPSGRPARLGEQVTVTLSAGEPLDPATVQLAASPAGLDLGAFTNFGTSFIWSHVVAAGDPVGDFTLTAQASDRSGNPGDDAALQAPIDAVMRQLGIDSKPPVVDTANILVNGPLASPVDGKHYRNRRDDDTRTETSCRAGVALCYPVEIVLPVSDGPIDLAASVVSLSGAPLSYDDGNDVWHMAAPPTLGNGPRTLHGIIVDGAGNATPFSTSVQIVFDFAAPQVWSAFVTPNPAGNGATAVLHLSFDEQVDAAGLAVDVPGKPGFFSSPAGDGVSFEATHSVTTGGPAPDTSGTYTVDVQAADLAGNSASLPGVTSFVLAVDGLKPGLSVDFGADGQDGSDGFVVWSPTDGHERHFGGAHGFAVTIYRNSDDTGTDFTWHDLGNLSGTGFDDLVEDGLERDGSLYLTFKGLPADTYTLTSFHHADQADETTSIWVTDKNHPISAQILLGIESSTGNTPPTIATVALESDGVADVQIRFDDGPNNDEAWLNGFSLQQSSFTPRLSKSSVFDGEQFMAEFTIMDDSRLATATMWVDDKAVPCSATAGTYQCPYTVLGAASGGTDAAGSKLVRIEVIDIAGNVLAGSAGAVMFELGAPYLLAAAVAPHRAAQGVTVEAAFELDKPIDTDTLQVTVTGTLAGPTFFTQVSNDGGQRFRYAYTLGAGEVENTVTVSIAAADLGGNTMPETPIGSFVIDLTAPGLSAGPTIDPAAPRILDDDDDLTVGFTAGEDLAAAPVMRLGSTAVVCSLITGRDYTCARTIAGEAEGSYAILLELRDLAGNVAYIDAGELSVDRSAPQVLAGALVTPGTVGASGTVAVRFAFDEAVQNVTVVAEQSGTRHPFAFSQGAPTFVYTLGAGGLSGTWNVLVSADDLYSPTPHQLVDESIGAFTVDATAPGLSSYSAPSFTIPEDTFEVNIEVSESLAVDPVLWVGGVTASCVEDLLGAPFYVCIHQVASGPALGGVYPLALELLDLAGNRGFVAAGSVSYDFAAPALVASEVSRAPAYAPADDFAGELHVAERDPFTGSAVTVHVHVWADEVLSSSSPPELVAQGTGTLTFTLASASGSYAHFTYAMSPPPVDGTYALELTWTDESGNTSATPIALSPSLVVDNAVAPLSFSDITLRRLPWGADDAAYGDQPGVPAHYVHGAAGAVVDANGAEVVAYSDATGTDVIGLSPVGADPAFHLDLSPAQLTVYLSLCNRAGAITPPQLVANHVWVASLGNKVAYSSAANPHVLAAASMLEPTLQGTYVEKGAADGVDDADGLALTTAGKGTWRRWLSSLQSPGPRRQPALAFDSWRSSILMFGGVAPVGACDGGSSVYCDALWYHDGTFATVTPEDPESDGNPDGRARAALAFDAWRGRTVLFGGTGPVACDGSAVDCGASWAWDGRSFARVVPAGSGPTARYAHGMVFDPDAGVVLAVSGLSGPGYAVLDDVQSFDGTSWSSVCSGGGCVMTGRGDFAAAYSRAESALVVFGGCTSYDGSGGCTAVSDQTFVMASGAAAFASDASAGPPARQRTAMAYDEVDRRLVMFGGCTDATCSALLADTWIRDDSGWSPAAPPTTPAARAGHAMAFDGSRGMVIMTGGDVSGSGKPEDVWGFDGSDWVRLGPPDPEGDGHPPARARHALAANRDGSAAVIMGGCGDSGCSTVLTDTWSFAGASWKRCPDGAGQDCAPGSTPPGRLSHAMAAADLAAGAVLFGGCATAACAAPLADTWTWNGSAWTQCGTAVGEPCETSPSGRANHALAYSAANSTVVLFGGCSSLAAGVCSGGYSAETWVWNGAWTQVTPSEAPTARGHHAMVTGAGGDVYLFGGCDGASCGHNLGDLWVWDPVAVTWANVTPAGVPSARRDTALAFDTARNRFLLAGGCAGAAPCSDSAETWEWDAGGGLLLPAVTSFPARRDHGLFFVAARGSIYLFGGSAGGVPLADHWLFDGGQARRPGHVLRVDIGSSEIDVASITSIAGRFESGGSAPAQPGDGVLLWVYSGGQWRDVTPAANDFGIGSTGLVQWTTPAPYAALLAGGSLSLAVVPEDDAGGQSQYGTVATDYVDVSVAYIHTP